MMKGLAAIKSKFDSSLLRLLVFCFSTAALFLLLTSTCSPFYVFNDWVDANAFFTMGKGMIHGLVPYRDLFEQKGPLLFLIHGLAYLISNTTFLGVFVLEVISLTGALFFAAKIVRMYVQETYIYFILPIFTCFPLISANFEGGDSAEEFCFPFIMLLLYLMIKYFKDCYPRPFNDNWAILAGVSAGCVAMIKYTLLGYWIGFALVLGLSALHGRRFKDLFWNAAFFIIGLLLAIAPWMLYFAFNHAINDFFFTYFYVNIHFYSKDITLLERIRFIGQTLSSNINTNNTAAVVALIGLGTFSFNRRYFSNFFGKLALPLVFATLAATTYFGAKSIRYYFLAFFPFFIFGLIAIANYIHAKAGTRLTARMQAFLAAALCCLLIFLSISFSPNTLLMNLEKEDYPQYKFAELIKDIPGATLLNYGFLDGGFYTAANITPDFKYFMINNISYAKFPAMKDEQNRYIREKLATFVVIRMDKNADAAKYEAPFLQENYVLVDEMVAYYKSSTTLAFKYALYMVKS